MGLLSRGADPPLKWDASKQHIQHVKSEGLKQFLHIYESKKSLRNKVLKWGDEVEYSILVKEDGSYKLQCAAPELLARLEHDETDQPATAKVTWHPEYSNWQIEGTPAAPYRCYVTDLLLVEPNMALRRSIVQKLLHPGQYCCSLTNVAMLGQPGYVVPEEPLNGPVACSRFLSDTIINPHPRFACLTANIRRRRGGNVDIVVPLFEDDETPASPEEAAAREGGHADSPCLQDGIRMDAMGFGMGSNCLQVTLQARDIDEGRVLYDQLAVVAPIMLAVTAASPAWRGHLAATDVRWNVISQSVDCRTSGERGEAALAEGEQRLSKSRYAGISAYITPRPGERTWEREAAELAKQKAAAAAAAAQGQVLLEEPPSVDVPAPEPEPASEDEHSDKSGLSLNLDGISCCDDPSSHKCKRPVHLPEYDDVEVPVNQEVLDLLLANGIDSALATHVAWMYVRDPLVVYESQLEQDPTADSGHFENIQSTNWNSVRFKLPPPGTDIGWRVEFRTMELQLTDFENAAFSIFTVLLSRVIIAFNMNLYIPMSKNDANMETAHAADAVTEEKFYFRKQCVTLSSTEEVQLYHSTPGGGEEVRTHNPAEGFLRKRFPAVFGAGQRGGGGGGGLGVDGSTAAAGGSSGEGHHSGGGRGGGGAAGDGLSEEPNAYGLMSCDEILNGTSAEDAELGGGGGGGGIVGSTAFPGLIPLIHAYLDLIECEGGTRAVLNVYLELVGMRASGELQTLAKWMRNFITAHDEYAHDSKVAPSTHNDLMEACLAVGNGTLAPKELLGNLHRRMQAVQASLAEAGLTSPAMHPSHAADPVAVEPLDGGGGLGTAAAAAAGGGRHLGRSDSIGSDPGGAWDCLASERWHDILGRLGPSEGDDADPGLALRGASLNDRDY